MNQKKKKRMKIRRDSFSFTTRGNERPIAISIHHIIKCLEDSEEDQCTYLNVTTLIPWRS